MTSKLVEEEEHEEKFQLEGFVLTDASPDMTGRGDPNRLNTLPAEAHITRAQGLRVYGEIFPSGTCDSGGSIQEVTRHESYVLVQALCQCSSSVHSIHRRKNARRTRTPGILPGRGPTTRSMFPGSHLELLDKGYAPAATAEIQRLARNELS